jgi:hypothetical protein
MNVDPKILLSGETPRLLDEWQEQPKLWNYVHREVDSIKNISFFNVELSLESIIERMIKGGCPNIFFCLSKKTFNFVRNNDKKMTVKSPS